MTAVHPPHPGHTVLACRCGKALDLTDMHIVGAGCYGNGDPKLGAIVCADCAKGPPPMPATTTDALADLGDGVHAERLPGPGAPVRAACPRCPWRSWRTVTLGFTPHWRQKLAADLDDHTCTNPNQETP